MAMPQFLLMINEYWMEYNIIKVKVLLALTFWEE